MDIQTKYASIDEITQFYPEINLRQELGTEEKAQAFMFRIETRMESYINSNFNRNITLEYPQFTDYQKLHYKLALIEQAVYIFRNSELSVDSGYDPEKGEIMNKDRLNKLSISENAKEHLITCGIWNRNLNYRGLVGNVWWW